VGGFDPREGGVGTLLLGLLTESAPVPGEVTPPQISLERCPPEMLGDIAAPIPDYSSSSVPLLVGWSGGS
jgi:hypothetical protein